MNDSIYYNSISVTSARVFKVLTNVHLQNNCIIILFFLAILTKYNFYTEFNRHEVSKDCIEGIVYILCLNYQCCSSSLAFNGNHFSILYEYIYVIGSGKRYNFVQNFIF